VRYIGIDFGSKTIGIAISDALNITAQGYETIKRLNEIDVKDSIERIREIIEEFNITEVVLGFPKNMDGSIGERAEKTLWFKKLLEKKIKMEVILFDERLSTSFSEKILISANVKSRHKRKKVIDQMAASYILQGYMDSIGGK